MKEKEIEELIDKLIENSKTATLRFPRNRLESEIVSETKTTILSRFRELQKYKDTFDTLWDFCSEQTHKQIELVKRAEQVERLKEWLDRAVLYLRIGKTKFAPNTTNSLVDQYLKEYDNWKERET
jgi:regulator of sirC expression with transglutaminase-like and TPR domain